MDGWGLKRSAIFAGVATSFIMACGSMHEPGPVEMKLDPQMDGRALYLDACAICHGAGGRGDGPIALELKTQPPDLTRIAARRGGEFNIAELREVIDGRIEVRAHGSREMPVWGERFGQQRNRGANREAQPRTMTRRIVDYIESIQRYGERN